MKRFIKVISVILMVFVLSACSSNTGVPKPLSKEGVAPYALSERDSYLLSSLGVRGETNIISFKAPTATKKLKVSIYILKDNFEWEVVRSGEEPLGQDVGSNARLEGTFGMLLQDSYGIDFTISTGGTFTYKMGPLETDDKIVASTKGFLTEFQEIEINKEIPVALMVYSAGTSMRSYTPQDFFTPSIFEEMDIVQAVTLNFMDDTMEELK